MLFVCTQFECQTVVFEPSIGPYPGQSQSSSIPGASLSNGSMSYPGHSLGEDLPLCRDAVSVFCCPSRPGFHIVFYYLFYFYLRFINLFIPAILRTVGIESCGFCATLVTPASSQSKDYSLLYNTHVIDIHQHFNINTS